MKVLNSLLLKMSSKPITSKREKTRYAPDGMEEVCTSREKEIKENHRYVQMDKQKGAKDEHRGSSRLFQQVDFSGGEYPPAAYARRNLQAPCAMMTLATEAELERWIACSHLSRTLMDIKQALDALPNDPVEPVNGRADPVGNACISEFEIDTQISEPWWRDENVTSLESDDLSPVDLDTLTPYEFVVYRFGCEIIRILCRSYCQSPPVLLLPERIPYENMNVADSYYDTNNRYLYIQRKHLENVGKFVLIIVHSLARIQVELSGTSDHPDFIKKLNEAIRMLALQLFQSSNRSAEGLGAENEADMKPGALSEERSMKLKQ
ncbi:uncharacterized protein [Pleurodeles waltl]|uniref:uncharacterized protein n=1 Tax=Pleurodeles waltl TaxID=8319 RepID=UPI0037095E6D